MDKSCQIALVEGMYINWTFHRLDVVEEAGSVRCWHRQFGWCVAGMGGVNQANWECIYIYTYIYIYNYINIYI